MGRQSDTTGYWWKCSGYIPTGIRTTGMSSCPSKWKGPYRIVAIPVEGAARLEDLEGDWQRKEGRYTQNTWQYEDDCAGCLSLIKEFKAQRRQDRVVRGRP
ncbi:hypothetical protein Pelo_18345 [Pelomyxa schiedti]|nr:hypothetical protein Pelo_18345 [Pelomyxa schiedti]